MLVANFNRYMNKHLNILSWENARQWQEQKNNTRSKTSSSSSANLKLIIVRRRRRRWGEKKRKRKAQFEGEKFLHTRSSNLILMIYTQYNNNNDEKKIAHHRPSMSVCVSTFSLTDIRSLALAWNIKKLHTSHAARTHIIYMGCRPL